MLLWKYLQKNKIAVKDFAETLNVTRGYLKRVICGYYKPGKMLIKVIEKETNGVVSARDFEKDQSFFDIHRG